MFGRALQGSTPALGNGTAGVSPAVAKASRLRPPVRRRDVAANSRRDGGAPGVRRRRSVLDGALVVRRRAPGRSTPALGNGTAGVSPAVAKASRLRLPVRRRDVAANSRRDGGAPGATKFPYRNTATRPLAIVSLGSVTRDGVSSIDASSCSGVSSGFCASIRAAMPAMIGAANDVPLRRFGRRPR
jgi:hypothetical protein